MEEITKGLNNLDTKDYFLVDTKEKLEKAMESLKEATLVALDSEGVSLSRTGRCTLVQIARNDEIFLLDLVSLSREDLIQTGLKEMLENESQKKLMWDGRTDCDALLHQVGIRVKGVVDLQVADVLQRRNKALPVNYVKGKKIEFP